MTNEFNGRAISGDISHYTEGIAEQASPQDFLDALDRVLDLPGVIEVRWEQYTPYFNDGDACVFSAGEARVKMAGDDAESGDYADGYRSAYDFYDYPNGWNEPSVELALPDVDVKAVKEALSVFDRELSAKHYVVLNQKFGDPAQVTATKEGFSVEHYEHD